MSKQRSRKHSNTNAKKKRGRYSKPANNQPNAHKSAHKNASRKRSEQHRTSQQTSSRSQPDQGTSGLAIDTDVPTVLMLFNKPYQVLCQFTDQDGRDTLANYINHKDLYAAGRLDRDSEGLLLLTNNGMLQHRIAHPNFKLSKTYLAQVEGDISEKAIRQLREGIKLPDGLTAPAKAERVAAPTWLWERDPPIRFRKDKPTSWLQLSITEGRNRQVRRMSAAVGYPTLRLVRSHIGQHSVTGLAPGEHCIIERALL